MKRWDGSDDDSRLKIAISSEYEVKRYGWLGDKWTETLDHGKDAIDLTRFEQGITFLEDHDPRMKRGLTTEPEVGKDRVLRGVITFSTRAEAQALRKDMLAGVAPYISVGYRIREVVLEREDEEEGAFYRVTRWEPLEVSSVAIPADPTVGVGRAAGGERAEDRKDLAPVVVRRAAPEQPAGTSAAGGASAPGATREEGNMAAQGTGTRTPPPGAGDAGAGDAGGGGGNAAPQVTREEHTKRIDDILAMGERWKIPSEEVRKWIREGAEPKDVATVILDRKAKELTPTGHRPAELVDLNGRDAQEYSLRRAILAAADGNWKHAGLEREVSDLLAKRFDRETKPTGFFIPTDLDALNDQERGMVAKIATLEGKSALARQLHVEASRQLVTTVATDGAELVFEDPMSFIELLRARMRVAQLGATMLVGLEGNPTFPRQTSASTFFWTGEDPGADVTDSILQLDQVQLVPKTGQASTSYSRQLLRQAIVSVEALVRQDLTLINALAADLAAINGSGASNQPRGVLNTTGIGDVSHGTNGGAPTWPLVVELETDIAAANADIAALAYLTTPGNRGKMKTVEKAANTARFLWADDNTVNGYRAEVSTQVPSDGTKGTGSNLHAEILGVWNQLLWGEWGAMELIVDPYRLKKQGLIELTSFMMMDVALRHPEAFSASKDIVVT